MGETTCSHASSSGRDPAGLRAGCQEPPSVVGWPATIHLKDGSSQGSSTFHRNTGNTGKMEFTQDTCMNYSFVCETKLGNIGVVGLGNKLCKLLRTGPARSWQLAEFPSRCGFPASRRCSSFPATLFSATQKPRDGRHIRQCGYRCGTEAYRLVAFTAVRYFICWFLVWAEEQDGSGC
jgi:hypothetical protein